MIRDKHRFDRTFLLVLIALEALLFFSFLLERSPGIRPTTSIRPLTLLRPTGFRNASLPTVWVRSGNISGVSGHAAGVLFPIEGALAGIIIGGTRLPQLVVLFLGFCALQVTAFTVARTIWKRRLYGYIALGLILSQITLWFWEGGGLFDFRMDFLAYCLYGIWACAVLRSQLFLHRVLVARMRIDWCFPRFEPVRDHHLPVGSVCRICLGLRHHCHRLLA